MHFHSCSLGETKALKPIIDKFDEVNLSVITNTGYTQAKQYTNANVRFLPFEVFLPFWLKPCKNLVVVEAELWLMLFYIAHKRCDKTILINARISQKSYPKYLRFRFFYKYLFRYIDLVLAQSHEDKQRLASLGATNIKVIGNIKSIANYQVTRQYPKPNKKVIVAASTHPLEEEMILKAFESIEDAVLIIVPRHPERFDEVYSLIQKYAQDKYKFAKIDQWVDEDVVLVDKMGELINIYNIADVVILGGSFVDNVGGHNPLEVAYFNKPLISGKYIFNQHTLFDMIEHYYLIEPSQLHQYLTQQLQPSRIKYKIDTDELIQLIS